MSGLSLEYRLFKGLLKLIGFKKYFNASEADMLEKARKDKSEKICITVTRFSLL